MTERARRARWRARSLAGLLVWLLAPPLQAAPTQWIEANHISLRYELAGHGPTVVLLHEMGTTLESWDALMPSLTARHRVLRYDLRGFGLSEKIRGSVSFDDEVADLSALLDGLGIHERVTLVGGAVGAAVALAFAAAHPERVSGVFAISPAAGAADAAQRESFLQDAADTETRAMRPKLDASMDEIYPASIRTSAERTARFRALQLSSDPGSMAATLRMIAGADFDPIWPRVRCPTLLVATSLYAARPAATLQAHADAMAHARLAVLPTGHFAALQSPQLLWPLLRNFLQEVSH